MKAIISQMRIFIKEVLSHDFMITKALTSCFCLHHYSPPRPHSPQDEGQIIFDVDVTGRRDSQVRACAPLHQSVATATPTTGPEVVCVCVCIDTNDNCCLPLVSMAMAPSVEYRFSSSSLLFFWCWSWKNAFVYFAVVKNLVESESLCPWHSNVQIHFLKSASLVLKELSW